jgi:8-oxo-dGTP diphosphatase
MSVTRVAAAVLCRGGRILVARRAKHKSHPGLWEFPGGKIEEGESSGQALVRELKEELNALVDPGPELLTHRHAYDFGVIELVTVLCWCLTEGALSSTDHDQLVWSKPEDLRSFALAPADIPTAERLSRGDWRELVVNS